MFWSLWRCIGLKIQISIGYETSHVLIITGKIKDEFKQSYFYKELLHICKKKIIWNDLHQASSLKEYDRNNNFTILTHNMNIS